MIKASKYLFRIQPSTLSNVNVMFVTLERQPCPWSDRPGGRVSATDLEILPSGQSNCLNSQGQNQIMFDKVSRIVGYGSWNLE
jgi:hypothetical protein